MLGRLKKVFRQPARMAGQGSADLDELIGMVLLFFEAQESGKLRAGHRVKWRGDSYLDDGRLRGIDLAGGWFDAGGTTWGSGHDRALQSRNLDERRGCRPLETRVSAVLDAHANRMDSSLEQRHPRRPHFSGAHQPRVGDADAPARPRLPAEMSYQRTRVRCSGAAYLLRRTRAAERSALTSRVQQIGEVDADHRSFQRAECDKSTPRTVYAISPCQPGSDLAANAAAAFAVCSAALAHTNPSQSADALTRAHQLYDFAKSTRCLYCDSLPEGKRTYASDNWQQYAFFAAAWLFEATGEPRFAEEVKQWQWVEWCQEEVVRGFVMAVQGLGIC